MTTIKLKNGSGAPAGGDLTQGEPALDLTNKRLYTENASGTVIEVGTNPGTDVTFADDRKAVFGAGSDLQIYHDGTNSYIVNTTNDLIIGEDTRVRIKTPSLLVNNAADNENLLTATENGAVTLFYNNASKLATTNTGIDVTGDVALSGAGSRRIDISNTSLTDTGEMASLQWDGNADLTFQGRASDGAFKANWYRIEASDSDGLADAHRFYTDSSVERMSITSTGVGIGTSAPDRQLSVNNFSGNGTVSINASTTGASTLYFADGNTGTSVYTGFIQYNHSDNEMQFATNGGTERMRIDSSGNVGIGTSNPADNGLHIEKSGTARVRLTQAGVRSWDMEATGGDWRLNNASNSIEAIRVDSSGQLILKANAGSPSHVFTYNENGGEIELLDENGAIGTLIDQASNNTRILELINGSNMQLGLGGSNTTGSILFMAAGNSEAARFDASGNLLVGTTSAPTGSTGGSGFIAESVGRKTLKIASTTTSGAGLAEFINPNGVVGTIVTNGSATTYNTSSDQRLKENIVDAPSSSDDIDAIQVRSFDWKADGSHQKYGMVAQELNTVAPIAVTEGETEEDMMGVDYSKLVPMLVKEIQSLRARVAQLEND